MDYFRHTYMKGMSNLEIFDHFDLDAIHWTAPVLPDLSIEDYFKEAGMEGGFILCPSDHFFDADPKLLSAFASEAHHCSYQYS